MREDLRISWSRDAYKSGSDLIPLFPLVAVRLSAGRLQNCTNYIVQRTPLTLFVHLTYSHGFASSAHAGERRHTVAAEPKTLNATMLTTGTQNAGTLYSGTGVRAAG